MLRNVCDRRILILTSEGEGAVCHKILFVVREYDDWRTREARTPHEVCRPRHTDHETRTLLNRSNKINVILDDIHLHLNCIY